MSLLTTLARIIKNKKPFDINVRKASRKNTIKAFNDIRKSAKENNLDKLTLEEINEEISLSRKGK